MWPIHSCFFLLTGIGLDLSPPFVFPPTFLPLSPSLPFHKTPLWSVPPRTRGRVIYLGVAPDGIDWCDMNNTPTELLFCQSTRRHGFDDTHAFLQNLNVIKSLKFTAGWH